MKISILTLLISLFASLASIANPNWENQILAFEQHDINYGFATKETLFIGSSSIRMWNTKKYFSDIYTINRGFGGSTVSDILDFYDRILKKYEPKSIVLYSGENDLQTKSAEAVYDDFKLLIEKILTDMPGVKITWILVKKSPARIHLNDKIDKLNSMIDKKYSLSESIKFLKINKLLNLDSYSEIFFRDDNLHFNDKAYQIISKEVKRIHLLP
jgi:lysophospholipase L1-like esterase